MFLADADVAQSPWQSQRVDQAGKKSWKVFIRSADRACELLLARRIHCRIPTKDGGQEYA